MECKPKISVIVPVYNGEKYLPHCIKAILGSIYESYELIVVDDGSLDQSAAIAGEMKVKLLQLPKQSGPAAARNFGAKKAQGDIIFFVDADVVLRAKTLSRVAGHFSTDPSVSAVFGSYDNRPAAQNFVSQYKNLLHHYVHQISNSEALTFWAGCGAIRRTVFFQVGGFDQDHYPQPSIEDIELGYRIRAAGHRILLDKQMQSTHLKSWDMKSLLRTDIFNRAIPWTRLILEREGMLNDLNLRTSDRLSAGLTGVLVWVICLSLFMPLLVSAIPVLLLLLLLLNHQFLYFF
jgi:glycosyltransferase involved in cell wall biosynthesis